MTPFSRVFYFPAGRGRIEHGRLRPGPLTASCILESFPCAPFDLSFHLVQSRPLCVSLLHPKEPGSPPQRPKNTDCFFDIFQSRGISSSLLRGARFPPFPPLILPSSCRAQGRFFSCPWNSSKIYFWFSSEKKSAHSYAFRVFPYWGRQCPLHDPLKTGHRAFPLFGRDSF